MRKRLFLLFFVSCLLFAFSRSFAEGGEFDVNRWYGILQNIQDAAVAQKISPKTINAAIQKSVFLPDVLLRDKSQPEFVTTTASYLGNAVNPGRIQNGKIMARKYPSLLKVIEKKYGIPKNVMLAFWGMESDYGTFKSEYVLSDSFLSLIYDGRREDFFTQQLLALMELSDKSNMDIKMMQGSWAGGMGNFQFIPTTLAQYGVDGNKDGKIDIHNSISDAMHSGGNYLKRMGWQRGDPILKKVILPENFNMALCDTNTKLSLAEWKNMGIIGVPETNRIAGIFCDISIYPSAYLTYENFYKIKKWNNSNNYAAAVVILAEELSNNEKIKE